MSAKGGKCWVCGPGRVCGHGRNPVPKPYSGAAAMTTAQANRVILPMPMPDSLGVAKRCATTDDVTFEYGEAGRRYLEVMGTPDCCTAAEPCDRHAMPLRDYVPKTVSHRRAA